MAFLDELRNSMGGGSPTKGAAKSVDPNDLKDLGLGGLPSFLGTREDAAVGKRGDAQIAATLTDSLPGYFNPETRDYVPWYVDLFDGGGINRSAGMLDAGSNAQGQAVGGVMSPMRPTARPEGLLTSDMPDTGMTGIPGYTLPRSDMPDTGMTGIPGYTLPQAPASLTPDPPVVRDKWSGRMFVDERGKPFDTELWQPEPNQPGRFRGTDYERPPQNPTITMPQEPTVPSLLNMATPAPRNSTLGTLRENVYSVGPIEAFINAFTNGSDTPPAQSSSTQVPAPAQSGQSVPASGGNMAINTPAAQGRDQMIADQQMLVEEQAIKKHPRYSEYVDFLNRYGLASSPGLFEQYLRTVVGNN
jgi:hypothetical protein